MVSREGAVPFRDPAKIICFKCGFMMGISAALLLYSILKNAFREGKSKTRNVYKVLRTIGSAGLGYNAVKGQPFRISIASGYAVCDKLQENEMRMDVYRQADVCMYKNKKQIKANGIR